SQCCREFLRRLWDKNKCANRIGAGYVGRCDPSVDIKATESHEVQILDQGKSRDGIKEFHVFDENRRSLGILSPCARQKKATRRDLSRALAIEGAAFAEVGVDAKATFLVRRNRLAMAGSRFPTCLFADA